MTLCVAMADPETKTVYMGADSLSALESEYWINRIPKILRVKVADNCDLLIGAAGSSLPLQALRRVWEPPRLLATHDQITYSSAVAESLLSTFERYMADSPLRRTAILQDDGSEMLDAEFVVAVNGWVWTCSCGGAVTIERDNWGAVGAAEIARAVLFATEEMGLSVEERIQKALEAAEYCAIGVARPFDIQTASRRCE